MKKIIVGLCTIWALNSAQVCGSNLHEDEANPLFASGISAEKRALAINVSSKWE